MAATKKAAPARPAEADLERLAGDMVRRVRERGAVARSELDVPKGAVALIAERLTAAGLEVRPKMVRVPLEAQLAALLSRGSVPLRGVDKTIAGATRAEARAAVGKLVVAGEAVVLLGDGEGDVARPVRDVLTSSDRTRIAAVVKALSALARPPSKSPLAPRARWADVTELIDDVLGRAVRDVGNDAVEIRGADTARPSNGLEAQLLGALRATRDESGIASIAAAAERIVPRPATEAFCDALRALASRGDVELRIASQPHLLSAEERALCPTDPAGRVLAYARVARG